MASYTLTGVGVQTLSPGVASLQVTVNALGAGYSVGTANPANYYKVGELRFGVQGFYLPTIYLDAQSQFINVPNGANQLGYSLLAAQNITVVEVMQTAAGPIGNPLRIDRHNIVSAPAAGTTTLWTYTVPANRAIRVQLAQAGIQRGTNAGNAVIIQSSTSIYAQVNSDQGTITSGYVIAGLAYQLTLFAGEQIMALSSNTAAPAYTCFATLEGVEFDMTAFTP